MASRNVIFWEVDTQADFMLPGGKLYVPGAERLLPNIRRLTDAARQGRVFLVSHGCYHSKNDPEFKTFPPHCIKGTPGSAYVPEALTEKVVTIPNDPAAPCPATFANISRFISKNRRSTSLYISRRGTREAIGEDKPNSWSSGWSRNTAFVSRQRDCSSVAAASPWSRTQSKP